jgi:hypothetical protein
VDFDIVNGNKPIRQVYATVTIIEARTSQARIRRMTLDAGVVTESIEPYHTVEWPVARNVHFAGRLIEGTARVDVDFSVAGVEGRRFVAPVFRLRTDGPFPLWQLVSTDRGVRP